MLRVTHYLQCCDWVLLQMHDRAAQVAETCSEIATGVEQLHNLVARAMEGGLEGDQLPAPSVACPHALMLSLMLSLMSTLMLSLMSCVVVCFAFDSAACCLGCSQVVLQSSCFQAQAVCCVADDSVLCCR